MSGFIKRETKRKNTTWRNRIAATDFHRSDCPNPGLICVRLWLTLVGKRETLLFLRFRRLTPPIRILRQVVGDCIPRRSIVYECVKLRSDSGIVVERSHPYRDFGTVRPITAKKTGAAVSAKRFDCAFASSIHPNQVATLQQLELFLSNPRLRANRRARMFPATFAMAVAGPDKWRFNFKPNRTTKTTTAYFRAHDGEASVQTNIIACELIFGVRALSLIPEHRGTS